MIALAVTTGWAARLWPPLRARLKEHILCSKRKVQDIIFQSPLLPFGTFQRDISEQNSMSKLAHNLPHLCSGRSKQICLQGTETNMKSMSYLCTETHQSADWLTFKPKSPMQLPEWSCQTCPCRCGSAVIFIPTLRNKNKNREVRQMYSSTTADRSFLLRYPECKLGRARVGNARGLKWGGNKYVCHLTTPHTSRPTQQVFCFCALLLHRQLNLPPLPGRPHHKRRCNIKLIIFFGPLTDLFGHTCTKDNSRLLRQHTSGA